MVSANTMAATGGIQAVTLATAQMPAHTHDAGTYNIGTGGDAAQSSTNGAVFRQDISTSAEVSGDSGSTGGGGVHSNIPPTLAINFIIKL